MKVIKKGRKQTGWSRELRCTGSGNNGGGCGSLLLVERKDVFLTVSDHYDGSTDYYATFRCPQCKVLTDIQQFPFMAEIIARDRPRS